LPVRPTFIELSVCRVAPSLHDDLLVLLQSLVVKEREFLHILRVHNTNLNGNTNVPFAFTGVKGIGRRYSILCVKKAGIDATKR